jgi:hypothetical protein
MSAVLIVCESSGRWAAAVRRQWPCRDLLHETRSAAECLERLEQFPESLAVVELVPARIDAGLNLLAAIAFDFRKAACVVATSPLLARYEWLARECGALTFVTAERQLRKFAQPVEGYFAARDSGRPKLETEIWSQLPWSKTVP